MLGSWYRYLAATLVINWLSSHEDPTLQRMAVAVISILVAKVKTLLTYCALVCCRKIAQHPLVPPVKSSSVSSRTASCILSLSTVESHFPSGIKYCLFFSEIWKSG